jgi:hypothetical protein
VRPSSRLTPVRQHAGTHSVLLFPAWYARLTSCLILIDRYSAVVVVLVVVQVIICRRPDAVSLHGPSLHPPPDFVWAAQGSPRVHIVDCASQFDTPLARSALLSHASPRHGVPKSRVVCCVAKQIRRLVGQVPANKQGLERGSDIAGEPFQPTKRYGSVCSYCARGVVKYQVCTTPQHVQRKKAPCPGPVTAH